MLTFPSMVRIFLCRESVDMRKSFDGLSGCVHHYFGAEELTSGHLFVFFNRRRTMVKILMWDRTGLCLHSKRLERGVFHVDERRTQQPLEMAELVLILEGIDLRDARRARRFRLEQGEEKKCAA